PNSERSTVGRTASGRAWPPLPWRRPRGPPRRTSGEVRRRVSENVSRAPSLALTWVARERYHKLLDTDFTGSPLVILTTISNEFGTIGNRFPAGHSAGIAGCSRPVFTFARTAGLTATAARWAAMAERQAFAEGRPGAMAGRGAGSQDHPKLRRG